MTADRSEGTAAEQDSWGPKNWTGAAFLPVGLVFMSLGLDGNSTFFVFGVIFFILSVAMFTQGRETARQGPTVPPQVESQLAEFSDIEAIDLPASSKNEEKSP